MPNHQRADQPGDQPTSQRRGRGPGRPFPKGVSGNPSGLPKAEVDDWEDDGLSIAERMRKVFGQDSKHDRGPAEKTLRKLLDSDTKGYLSQMASFERAESGKAGATTDSASGADRPETDEGTERAVAVARRYLEELAAKYTAKGQCPECGSTLPAGRPIT